MNKSANHSERVGAISDAHRIGNPGCGGMWERQCCQFPRAKGGFCGGPLTPYPAETCIFAFAQIVFFSPWRVNSPKIVLSNPEGSGFTRHFCWCLRVCGSESYSTNYHTSGKNEFCRLRQRRQGKAYWVSNLIAAEEGVSRFVCLTLLASYISRVCYHPSTVGIAVMMIMIMKLLLEAWIRLMRSGELSRLCRKQ